MTGAAAVYGASQQNGAKLAVDEINAAGDVKIDLKIEDDASDPNQGINLFKRSSTRTTSPRSSDPRCRTPRSRQIRRRASSSSACRTRLPGSPTWVNGSSGIR
ncbi:MAG: ABC transporter substrate-binding protein [Candidatus Limnocylindrales bacterium]